MNKIKKSSVSTGSDTDTHKGYNEKNPTQQQGAFAPDSMDNNQKAKTAPNSMTQKKAKK